jgi:hypothetical protein
MTAPDACPSQAHRIVRATTAPLSVTVITVIAARPWENRVVFDPAGTREESNAQP